MKYRLIETNEIIFISKYKAIHSYSMSFFIHDMKIREYPDSEESWNVSTGATVGSIYDIRIDPS